MSIDTSEAARTMRARRTTYNPDVSRANLDKANAALPEPKPCTCGQIPHKQPCPVYWREKQAERRAKKA